MSEQMNETARFQACWDNDSIMHICGDHDRCEDLDPRPFAGANWPKPDKAGSDVRHLRLVRTPPGQGASCSE